MVGDINGSNVIQEYERMKYCIDVHTISQSANRRIHRGPAAEKSARSKSWFEEAVGIVASLPVTWLTLDATQGSLRPFQCD